MTFQPGAMLNTQGFANRPENLEVPTFQSRAPASTDVNFPVGKVWIYTGNSIWYLLSQSSTGGVLSSNWVRVVDASTATSAQTVGLTSAMVAGVVSVSSNLITANSVIVYSRVTTGGTPGNVSITAQSAGSFTLTSSSATETSTFYYVILN